jgi:TonB family protein
MVRVLVLHHADVSLRDRTGQSALDVALLANASAAAAALSQAGARLDVRGANIGTLIEAALREDIACVIAGAIADGWNPNSKLRQLCPAIVAARILKAASCESVMVAAGVAPPDEHVFHLSRAGELDSPVRPVKCGLPAPRGWRPGPETLHVEFILSGEGRAVFARILDSPDRQLTTVTLQAAEGWIFSKPTIRGQPACLRMLVPVLYKVPSDPFNRDPSEGPAIRQRKNPIYPHGAVAKGAKGTVDFDVLVAADGTPRDVKILSPTNPAFESCALEALKGYRFVPRMIGYQPFDERIRLAIEIAP